MDRIIEKKKWPPKKIIGLSFAALFIIVVLYSLIFGDKSSKLNVETEKIIISTVARGPFQEFIAVTGTVIPIKTIYLDATEGGRVEKIFLEAGSFVNKNDDILKLGNTNLVLDVMYREALMFEQSNNLRNARLSMEQNRLSLKRELVELDYQVQNKKRTYDRAIELKGKSLISQEEFENIKDEYDYLTKRKQLALETQKQDSIFRHVQIQQLESSLGRMETNLEIVKQKQENLVLRAPIAGQLTSLNAEIGESKSPGERLGQIDVLDGFKVRVAVDEHYIARIEKGRTGSFEFTNNTYKLVINKIYPEVKEGRFEIDMEFAEKEPVGIRRGQTLHIRLELGDLSEEVLLPKGGFYQKTGGQWVFVVEGSGNVATKRKIKLGRYNTQVFEVLEGLEPGDRVITSSYDSFGDNDKLILK